MDDQRTGYNRVPSAQSASKAHRMWTMWTIHRQRCIVRSPAPGSSPSRANGHSASNSNVASLLAERTAQTLLFGFRIVNGRPWSFLRTRSNTFNISRILRGVSSSLVAINRHVKATGWTRLVNTKGGSKLHTRILYFIIDLRK